MCVPGGLSSAANSDTITLLVFRSQESRRCVVVLPGFFYDQGDGHRKNKTAPPKTSEIPMSYAWTTLLFNEFCTTKTAFFADIMTMGLSAKITATHPAHVLCKSRVLF